MAGQGTVLVDFGAFPGDSDTLVTVSAPSILSTSLVEAWIFPANTVDHTVDEHVFDSPRVVAGNIQAGVGFTIYALAGNFETSMNTVMAYGKWNVAWVWN